MLLFVIEVCNVILMFSSFEAAKPQDMDSRDGFIALISCTLFTKTCKNLLQSDFEYRHLGSRRRDNLRYGIKLCDTSILGLRKIHYFSNTLFYKCEGGVNYK